MEIQNALFARISIVGKMCRERMKEVVATSLVAVESVIGEVMMLGLFRMEERRFVIVAHC